MKTREAQIDVILPTYNRREFLPHAIECIRAQTFRDWRLIVVNDGGEDVSDIVSAAGDERVEYFNRPHLGKAAQLNFALSVATAPYIAYMDDDDEVFPEHLEKLHAAAVRVDSDFVYSDTYITLLDPQGRVILREVDPCRDMTPGSIRVFNCINHKQLLHARALVEASGGYDEEMCILIDFDAIKRFAAAARRPFHLREITGDHILRLDAKTGAESSISGLWARDPAEAGRSLLRFFSKDPAALATLYCSASKMESDMARLRNKLEDRPSARLRRLMRRLLRRGGAPEEFRDALPPVGEWREAPLPGGMRGFFRLADESSAELAAVNAVDAGERSRKVRELAFDGMPSTVPSPRFSMEDIEGGGLRVVHAPGAQRRWVMMTSADPLPGDFAFEFDYVPHSTFTEQLQIDFRMSSMGDRLRFMVRGNETLVANAVIGGRFAADARRLPFSFQLDVPTRVRFELRGGICSFTAGGRNLLSLDCGSFASVRGRMAALVFYEAGTERPVDFELRNFRYLLPQ